MLNSLKSSLISSISDSMLFKLNYNIHCGLTLFPLNAIFGHTDENYDEIFRSIQIQIYDNENKTRNAMCSIS